MAKINLTNQHNQENLGAVATLGVLMCLVVSIVGIKLWWFKHRLSFEQTSTQNGAAGGSPPAVLVPRRKKQPKYKKDKRYSQQIYDSAEVHGIFRQKHDEDFEIHRPQQLPPVRIRQLSNSTPSLILPPYSTRGRDQVHSTAFEEIAIATSPLTSASSSDLTIINESDTKISLTFEEFEKQFKLKEEIEPEVPEPLINNDKVIQIPVPPLRLNRSSSAIVKPEKTSHYLKSSHSVTIPEYHKVLERRPYDFSKPTDDLTKIQDYDKAKLFETFGQRRPIGYINYEEVDGHLQEVYEKELNEEAAKETHQLEVYGNWDSPNELPALKALGNELIIDDNDLIESFDVQFPKKNNFNIKTYNSDQLEDVKFKEEEFIDSPKNKTAEIKELSSIEFEELDSEITQNTNEVFGTEYQSNRDRTATEIVKDSQDFEENVDDEFGAFKERNMKKGFKSINERIPTKFVKDSETFQNENNTEFRSVKKHRSTELEKSSHNHEVEFVTELYLDKKPYPTEFNKNCETGEKEFSKELRPVLKQRPAEFTKEPVKEEKVTEFHLVKEYYKETQGSKNYVTEYHLVMEQKSNELAKESIFRTPSNENIEIIEEDFDSWPQFEEKIETPKVNVRRFNTQDFFGETNDFITANEKGKPSISFNEKDINEKCTLNQRRPTGFARNWPESPEISDPEEWQEALEDHNKLYNQVRSLMTTETITQKEHREVTFDSSARQTSNIEDNTYSAIKQRRPTGFVKTSEYSVTFNDDSDEEPTDSWPSNQRNPTYYVCSNVDIEEIQPKSKVKFEDSGFSTWAESETEKCTLNQRRLTDFVRPSDSEQIWNDIYLQQESYDFPKTQVKFDETTDFKDEEEIRNYTKQRRPTGYITKLDMMDVSDNETYNQNSQIKQRRPTGLKQKFSLEDEEVNKYDFDDKEISHNHPAVRFKEMDQSCCNNEDNSDSLIKLRRPTGFVRKEDLAELEKHVNFQLNNEENDTASEKNEALKQRRPTGFIKRDENIDEVDFQITQSSDEDEKVEFGDEAIRQKRPSGFIKKKKLKCLDHPAPIYQPPNGNENTNDFDDHLWREMEKDVDFTNNIEEEFANIRHCYELNEGDFLEKSPLNSPQPPSGFGKTIDDDWDNFEKLKIQNTKKDPLKSPHEIQISFSDVDSAATTSILKEEIQPKPRKSKVTFDFKTDERVIPARKSHNYTKEDSDYDDGYDRSPPITPPQPMKRLSIVNYNNETTLTPIVTAPTTISLFGSQISQEDNNVDDSWSAIRKHRNLTGELQNLYTDTKLSSPPPEFNTPPPKSSYRNPMAQLAIQRAKEARADLDGFKSRSINNKKPEAPKRQKQTFLDLNDNGYEGTEA